MKILALSTSTPRGTVALVEDGRVLGAASYEDLAGHAERIFGAIDEALRVAALTRGAIQGIACDVGPGSFTGVRVGVAATKGIALALGVPTAGIGSLEAMAAAARQARPCDAVFAAIDAKKGEVFVAAYDSAGGVVLAPRHVLREEAGAVAAALLGRIVCVGAILSELEGFAGNVLRGDATDLPDAAALGLLASARGVSRDPAELDPVYVRAPDAKLLVDQGRT
jgi:tRNA threonylcarbamoyladenosine biosynthesis protein TsaB